MFDPRLDDDGIRERLADKGFVVDEIRRTEDAAPIVTMYAGVESEEVVPAILLEMKKALG